MLDKIHIFISIFAALVVTIISIAENAVLAVLSARLIVVIVLFYFVGLFIRHFLKSEVFSGQPGEETPGDGGIENENRNDNALEEENGNA